jgi:hypothetical protein
MSTTFETQYQFSAYLRNPENELIPSGIEPRRMAIYKDLFFNNINSFITNAFPVIHSMTSEADWIAMIRDFMVRHRCKTPIFHEIAREFLDYLANDRDTEDAPFLQELAHYEWVELALSVSDAETNPAVHLEEAELLKTRLKTSSLAWPLAYNYEVHKISSDYQPTSPVDSKVFILVYRDRDDKITFIELNPISARLIDLLNSGMTGLESATHIANELQHPNIDVVIEGAKGLIQDWLNRQILELQ